MGSLDGTITFSEDIRPCYVNGEKALFHRWINKNKPILKINQFVDNDTARKTLELFYDGIITQTSDVFMQNSTLAIVEFSDGSVAEVEPSHIRFADNRINEYAFGRGQE